MLFDHDVLVIDQIRSFLSNDFLIHDPAGVQIGYIQTKGGLGSRLLMGNRDLTVMNIDGSRWLNVHDSITLGRDRFEVTGPDGDPVAQLVQNITIFRKKMTAHLASGGALVLGGSWLDFDFHLAAPNGDTVATVTRHWTGLAQFLLDRERYVLTMAPALTADIRQAILGTVIALDLVRAKQRSD